MNKTLKWIAFVVEGILAIPLLGGAIIIANGWVPLLITGILHAAAIVLLLMSKRFVIAGNLAGLAGALFGWIPIVGWAFHALSAVILLFEAVYLSRNDSGRVRYS